MATVILDQTAKVVLVRLLLAESLHRTNTGHGFNEVLDQSRRGDSLLAVALIRSKLEPAGQDSQWNQRNQQDQKALWVEQEQSTSGEEHEHAANH